MPSYRTRTKKAKKKKRVVPKKRGKFTRDPRKLLRWAAQGSHQDYEQLRALAKKARDSVPSYIEQAAYDKLQSVDRTRMLSEMITETQQNEQHNISGGFFNDALSWLLDKVPLGNWLWPVGAAQGALKAHKGDSINEVDEEYARLVGASYEDSRPYTLDHWRRQTQFDSEYISVWDNLDGHRLIAVRGTAGPQDIGQDILVGLTGHSTDRIGAELRQILDATPEDTSPRTAWAAASRWRRTTRTARSTTAYTRRICTTPPTARSCGALPTSTRATRTCATLSTSRTPCRWAASGTAPPRTWCFTSRAPWAARTPSRSGRARATITGTTSPRATTASTPSAAR